MFLLSFVTSFVIIQPAKADTNLINWPTSYTWDTAASSYAFVDYSVTHNGNPSLRLESDYVRGTREIDGVYVSVQPGDTVYYGVWCKTASYSPTTIYTGGRLFIDLQVNLGYRLSTCIGRPNSYSYIDDEWRSGYIAADHYTGTVPETTLGTPTLDQFKVQYGVSDWTYIYWNFTIPDTYFVKDITGTLDYGGSFQISSLGVGLDARENTGGFVWFADAELYVNPSEGGAPPGGGGGDTYTFGKTDIGASTAWVYTTNKTAIKFSMPADGDVSSISFYGYPDVTCNMKCAIYSDNAGAVNALLGVTQEASTAAWVASWHTYTFSSNVSLVAGTYWLAFVADNTVASALYYYYDTGGTNQRARFTGATTYAAEFTDPFGAATYDTREISIYATYTNGTSPAAIYNFATSSVIGEGLLTFEPSNVTTLGVVNGSFISGLASSTAPNYGFSYINITFTGNGSLYNQVNFAPFTMQMIENFTFTAVFTEVSSISVPSVTINKPYARLYTSGSFNISITSTDSIAVWYNFVNGSDWVYDTNVTYTDEDTLTGFSDGDYTCYAWAVSEDSYVDSDSVAFSVDTSVSLPAVNMDAFWIFLYEGNYLGAVQAYFVVSFLNLETAIALIAMLFLVPLYLRTRSLLLICILWILLGGFVIAAMPLASGIAVLFMVLGVGGLVYRLFRGSSTY